MTAVEFYETGRGQAEGSDGTRVALQWSFGRDGTTLFYEVGGATAKVHVYPWADNICEEGANVRVFLIRWPEWETANGRRLFTEEEYVKLRSDLLVALPAMGSGAVTFEE